MAYMLQTNTNGQRIAPFVPTTLDFCALCNMAIIVRLASALRYPETLDSDVSSLRHLVAYVSVWCFPVFEL